MAKASWNEDCHILRPPCAQVGQHLARLLQQADGRPGCDAGFRFVMSWVPDLQGALAKKANL
jgi:hypothetical protein